MARIWTGIAGTLNSGVGAADGRGRCRGGLRLAVPTAGPALRGPDKYRVLDLRRRRAQIRARRALQIIELIDATRRSASS